VTDPERAVDASLATIGGGWEKQKVVSLSTIEAGLDYGEGSPRGVPRW